MRELQRWSAAALVLSGGLQVIGTALHPNDTAATAYMADARWLPAHLCLAASFLLAVYGLMGLYLYQRSKVGVVGAVGFVLSVAGAALLVAATLVEAFLLPFIAASQSPRPLSDWLDLTGPLAGAVVVSVISLLCYTYGFAILGVVTWRARVLAPRAGLLLVLATILSDGEFFGPIGFVVYVLGGVLVGVALAWLGLALWRASAVPS
jgi:hypothetical protein